MARVAPRRRERCWEKQPELPARPAFRDQPDRNGRLSGRTGKLTTPEQQPLLHFWRTNWAECSAWLDEQRLSQTIRISREVFQAGLEAVIANHFGSNAPIVLEGDFMLPELATKAAFDGEANWGRVRSIFVYDDETQIAANLLAREGEEVSGRARSSSRSSRWLCSECERLGVPTVSARPWNTVLERALAIIGV